MNVNTVPMAEAQELRVSAMTNTPTRLQSAVEAGIQVLQNRTLLSQETGGKTDLISEPTVVARGTCIGF